METPPGEGALELVLTPRFYMMKRDELPLRFAFQARKLAPSLFEESAFGDAMRYEVIKEGERWLYFAYNPEEVRHFLREHGIDPHRVRTLYFTQQFASSLDRPGRLPGGREALVLVDGTVTLLPASLLEEPPTREASTLTPPRQRFSLPRSGDASSGLGRKTAFTLAVAALLLGIGWLAEGIRYQRSAHSLGQELERVLQEHPTLRSRLTRENIHGKYSRIDKHQRQIRDTVRTIGILISKDSKLNTLAIDEKGYRANISVPRKKLRALKELAAESGLLAAEKSGRLEVAGAWK